MFLNMLTSIISKRQYFLNYYKIRNSTFSILLFIAIKEIRNSHLNKKHRPVLTARSETALDTMRVYNLIGPLEVTAKQEVTNDENNGYTISETLELRAANSKAEPTEVIHRLSLIFNSNEQRRKNRM